MFRLNPGLPWTGQSPASLCPQLSTMPTEHKLILHTLNWGMNLLTSCCQLCSVEAGATTRKGPQMLCVYKNETPYGWLHALVTFHKDNFQKFKISCILDQYFCFLTKLSKKLEHVRRSSIFHQHQKLTEQTAACNTATTMALQTVPFPNPFPNASVASIQCTLHTNSVDLGR